MQQPTSLPRRRLLAGSASALAAAGLASFQLHPQPSLYLAMPASRMPVP